MINIVRIVRQARHFLADSFKKRLKLTVLGLGILILVAVAIIAGTTRTSVDERLSRPDIDEKDSQTLIGRVGRLIDLPADEVPTIYTVSDKNNLSKQVIFRHAENGDKVLIYVKARRAILYRLSTDKVIDAGPVYIPDPPSEQNPSPNEQ